MLWRALKHVENGFYIDLGAQDPVVDSVSLAFYERGWKGIHVEPTPRYAQMLREQRVGDKVIEAAVGNKGDMLTFFEISGTGISTADPKIAKKHRERGFDIQEIIVPCIRLETIFTACGNKQIHWMKVDVEGFEFSALSSWGNSKIRPWILVIESTLPLSQIESYQKWEPLILKRGYAFVYFDGLNRFYVSKDSIELKQAFSAPPNIFDDFSVNGTASSSLHTHLKQKHAIELLDVNSKKLLAEHEIETIRENGAAIERDLSHQLKEYAAQLARQHKGSLTIEQALRAEIASLKTDTVRMSESIAAAKDELTAEVKSAYAQALKSTNALVDREKELTSHAADQQLKNRLEVAALRGEVTRITNLLIESKDKLECALQAASGREKMLADQIAARERLLQSEITTLRLEAERSINALGRLKIEHDNLKRSAASQMANLEAKIVRGQELSMRREAEFDQIKQEKETLVAKQETVEKRTLQIGLENRQLREHLAVAKAELVAENSRSRDCEFEISNLNGRLASQASKWFAIAYKNSKINQLTLDGTGSYRSQKRRHALYERFALLTSSTEIREDNFYFSDAATQEVKNMEQNRFIRAIFQPTFEFNSQGRYHVDDFLVLHDKLFVDTCFRALLKREADAAAIEFYTDRIRVGISKLQILQEINTSVEGVAAGVTVDGLEEAARHRWWCELPFIGAIIVAISFLANLSSYLRDWRVMENHLIRTAEQIQAVNELNLNSLSVKTSRDSDTHQT